MQILEFPITKATLLFKICGFFSGQAMLPLLPWTARSCTLEHAFFNFALTFTICLLSSIWTKKSPVFWNRTQFMFFTGLVSSGFVEAFICQCFKKVKFRGKYLIQFKEICPTQWNWITPIDISQNLQLKHYRSRINWAKCVDRDRKKKLQMVAKLSRLNTNSIKPWWLVYKTKDHSV